MRVNFWLSGMQQNHFWILSNFHICERETWDECLVVKSDVIANDLGQRWLPSPLGNHIICLAARWHLQGDKFLSSAIWSVVLWRIIFDTVEWCTIVHYVIHIWTSCESIEVKHIMTLLMSVHINHTLNLFQSSKFLSKNYNKIICRFWYQNLI